MVPTTFEAVAVILLAIVPGYLAIHAWYLAKTWEGLRGDLGTILRSLVASLVVQVPMFPIALAAGLYPITPHVSRLAWTVFFWLLGTVLAVPLVAGFLLGGLYDYYLAPLPKGDRTGLFRYLWLMIKGTNPPTAWDAAFLYHVPSGAALVVTFDDGTQVAGSWEEPGFAKTSPNPPGLFLPEEWNIGPAGDLTGTVTASKGLLIPDATKIKSMRILKWDTGDNGAEDTYAESGEQRIPEAGSALR